MGWGGIGENVRAVERFYIVIDRVSKIDYAKLTFSFLVLVIFIFISFLN